MRSFSKILRISYTHPLKRSSSNFDSFISKFIEKLPNFISTNYPKATGALTS